MIPSRNQQEHLASFAPQQSLDKYSKGADPEVISGIIALDEMKQQAAMRQHANLANGAASGQMPTVRDKIMALFRGSNPQQAQMQPNPMQQGIAARAHPNLQTVPAPEKYAQEAPQEAPFEAYAGGVARLPVRDDMFGYAGGGIIAFNSRGSVPRADDELPADEAEGSRKRMKQRTDMTPESMAISDLDFTSLPQMDKSQVLQKAMQIAQGEGKAAPDNTDVKKALAFASAPLAWAADAALSVPKGIQTVLQKSFRNPLEPKPEGLNFTSVSDARNAYLNPEAPTSATATSTTEPAPTGKPQLQGPRTLVGDAAIEQARLEIGRAHV